MIPSVDERLASVIRALTDVVLPSLPPEAGLAQEQVHLCLGQLQILQAQIDGSLAFEAEELADAAALARELTDDESLATALSGAEAARDPAVIRAARIDLHEATATLIARRGSDPSLARTIIAAEKKRVVKERAWFAPFGFDIAPPTV